MRIAITSTAADMDAPFDPRFGRAAYFIVIDEETEDWQAHPNPAVNASDGAGVQAAQFVANQGVWAVISGGFGPNAHQALTAAGLAIFLTPSGEALTVRQLLARYRGGQLQKAGAPTRARHYGMGRGQR
jgi:predicted Fe-Mo cluster-binding NifX family protein